MTSDADGNLSALGGSWTFTPDGDVADIKVAGVVPDPDYLNFGYWWTFEAGGDSVDYGVFGQGSYANYDLAAGGGVEGKATYKGQASGFFMRKTLTPDGEPTHPFIAGGFDADVTLNAAFGGSAVAVDDQFKVRRHGVDLPAVWQSTPWATGSPECRSIPIGRSIWRKPPSLKMVLPSWA